MMIYNHLKSDGNSGINFFNIQFLKMSGKMEEKEINDDMFELPSIDISSFMNKDLNDLIYDDLNYNEKILINKIQNGFQKMGFLMIKGYKILNNNIDFNELMSKYFDISMKYFNINCENNEIKTPIPRGFSGINKENFGSLIGLKKSNDLVVKYRIGPEYHNNKLIKIYKNKGNNNNNNNQYYGTKQARILLYPNIWPNEDKYSNIKGFKDIYIQCYNYFYKISQVLLKIFGLMFDNYNLIKYYDKHTSIMTSNYYPNRNDIKNTYNIDINKNRKISIHEHCDIDLFTIIYQSNNNDNCLQILYNNKWNTIPINDDCLIINIGDLFEYLTNNKWVSTKHRVLIPNKSRQINGFFVGLNHDAILKPLAFNKNINITKCNSNDINKKYNNSGKININDFNKHLTYFEWRKKRIKNAIKKLKSFTIKNNKP